MPGKKVNEATGISSVIFSIFILSIFLFLIRVKVYSSIYNDFDWYTQGDTLVDLCAYFRMQAFLTVTALSSVQIIYELLCTGAKYIKTRAYIPMLIYAAFVLLAFLLSDYKQVAKIGYIERFEGTFVHIAYMLILFYAMNSLRTEKAAKAIFFAFAISCALLSFWGIAQTIGIDVNNLPDWLIVPPDLIGKASVSSTKAQNIVKLFFSNRNYSSYFLAMPIPLFAMLCIGEGRRTAKIMLAALVGLLFFSLYGSDSLGGMFAAAVVFIFALALFGFKRIKGWAKSIALIAVFVIIATAAGMPKIIGQLKTVEGLDTGFGIIKTAYADEPAEPQALLPSKIDYVKTEGTNIIYSFDGEAVTIETEDTRIKSVTKADGNELSANNEYFTSETVFDEANQIDFLYIYTEHARWDYITFSGEIYFVSPGGSSVKLGEVPSLGFKNSEGFGTNRGYIWSRTLPLIKDTILVGHGADTYTLYFPHHDYAGKYNNNMFNNTLNILVDKPHNIYLGIAVNIGVLGLISLLTLYGIYIVKSFKLYRKAEYSSYLEFLGAGILLAVIGYLAGGLTNDSTVQITPVFYVILGLGFAVNSMVEERTNRRIK